MSSHNHKDRDHECPGIPQWEEEKLATWEEELSKWQPSDPTPVTEESWRPFPVYRDEQTWQPHVRLSARAVRAIQAWARK